MLSVMRDAVGKFLEDGDVVFRSFDDSVAVLYRDEGDQYVFVLISSESGGVVSRVLSVAKGSAVWETVGSSRFEDSLYLFLRFFSGVGLEEESLRSPVMTVDGKDSLILDFDEGDGSVTFFRLRNGVGGIRITRLVLSMNGM